MTDSRRALEALRSGVPNPDAVGALGSGQQQAIEAFQRQIGEAEAAVLSGRQVAGLLVAGGFGAGKSHLLEYLKHAAFEANFVCSIIVISKETPLYDPAKVYAAAVANAEAPNVVGDALREIALRLRPKSPTHADFYHWANQPDSGLSPVFPATLMLHEHHTDMETLERIRGFWAGERLAVAEVRSGLRHIGQAATYAVGAVPARELPFQRFKFAARLMRAAGYRGWVLLIDEVELIARYSRLQRARSYGELARWLGRVEADQYPGLVTVASITDDYAQKMLQEKDDETYIGPWLRDKGTEADRARASRAETGMRIIGHEFVSLQPPDAVELERTYRTLRELYQQAYAWIPPDVGATSFQGNRSFRSHVRRAINEWDLLRLYPGETVNTVEQELRTDYTEDRNLETPPEGDAAGEA